MKIQLKGIKRNTPSGLSEDGEMEEMVNLRFKDGAFRPIPARTAIFSGLPYSNVYVHSNSGYKHYLGVKTTAAHDNVYIYIGAWSGGTTYTANQAVLYNSSYYYLSTGTTIGAPPGYGSWVKLPDSTQVVNGNITIHIDEVTELYFFAKDVYNVPTQTTPVLICQVGKLATFTQIGNVININDENGLKHAIWYDSAYVVIGSNFDGAQADTELIGKVDLKVDAEKLNDKALIHIFKSETSFGSDFSANDDNDGQNTEEIKLRTDTANSLIEKVKSIEAENGKLIGLIQACTAIELYDGSYILHSNPVLLGIAADKYTRYENFTVNGLIHDYKNNRPVFYPKSEADNNIYPDPNANPLPDYQFDSDNKYNTECEPFAYKSSQSVSIEFAPTFTAWWNKITLTSQAGTFPIESPVYILSNRNLFKYKINKNIDNKYQSLIKSISFFITKEVHIENLGKNFGYTYNNKREHTIEKQVGSSAGTSYLTENYFPTYKTNAEIIKELADNQTFYKVHEVPFDDIVEGSTSSTAITPGDWIDIDLKGKLGDSLLTQEVLPYDNFSHHQTLPEVQFVYNSKLHAGNYKTLLSRGFPASHMFAHQGIGQFPAPISTYNDLFCYIEVSIKTTNGLSKVVRYANYSEFGQFGMISYPDARATNIVIYVYAEIVFGTLIKVAKKLEYKLTPSDTCNFAYYINPDLKPISIAGDIVTLSETAPAEVQREQIFSNTLKVSEVNNPFIFPVENTYQIGNGQIRALSTNTIALSTGQFGEFPVYVFCTDGIYGLFIGGAEVNYASSRPISREVCNNPLSVKPIDNGVIFTTDKGVMIISGSQVKDLSESLRGEYFNVDKTALFKKAISNNKLVQLLPEVTNETLLDFIDNCIVGYNYIEHEVWFTNPQESYSYVFNQGMWYKVKQIGQVYVNDYPKQYILNSGSLVDISTAEGTATEVMFLTRPLKLQTNNFKGLVTSIIRGFMNTENKFKTVEGQTMLDYKRYSGIYVFGSYDCQRWGFLGGTEKNGELNDLGTSVERTDCKYFRIGFVGNITNTSTIEYLELEGKQSILASKQR